MNWLASFGIGVLCAVLGGISAGYIADRCIVWFHISSFEGKSGYFFVALILVGLLAGLLVGLVVSRLITAPLQAVGAAAAIVLAIGLAVLGVARLTGDVPPTIRGDGLNVILELRYPVGATPDDRPYPDGDSATMTPVDERGYENRRTTLAFVDWSRARVDQGSTIVPFLLSLHSASAKRRVHIRLKGSEIATVMLPIPAHPKPEHERWTDWIGANEGISYRLRVQRWSETESENKAREQARLDAIQRKFDKLTPDSPIEDWLEFLAESMPDEMRSRAGETIRRRSGELAGVIPTRDERLAILALRGVEQLNEVPAEFGPALRDAAAQIAASIRLFQEAPQTRGSESVKNRFILWCNAWERLPSKLSAWVPEQLAIIEREAEQVHGVPSISDITSLSHYYRERWFASK